MEGVIEPDTDGPQEMGDVDVVEVKRFLCHALTQISTRLSRVKGSKNKRNRCF